MMRSGQIVLLSAVRLHAPLIALLALSMLALGTPGTGVGLLAGLMFALALVLHMLVFGAAALRRAAPPFAARVLLVLGASAAFVGAGLPGWAGAPMLMEGALFAATAAAAALIVAALAGRAPSLRDEEW